MWMVVSRALAGYSVRSGLAVTQRAAGANMSVDVAAGTYLLNNVPGTYAATTNVAVDAADSTNPRLDILYINSSGVLTIAKGTAAAISPAGETNYKKFEVPYPADLSGTAGIPLAIIHVGAGVSTITDANIWMIGSISELGYLEKLITDTIAKGAPRAQDTPDMTIYVPAIQAYINGALVSFPGGNSAAMVAPAANPRIDRVYLTDAGALAISTGAEDASPTAPALVANTVPICLVYHRVGSVHIDDADDGSNSYIYRDDRPLFGGVSTPAAILDTILTTRGDLLYRSDGTSARLAKGAANTVLAMGDSDPAWSTVTALLDAVLGSTANSVASRGADSWGVVTPTEQTVLGRITGGSLAALSVAQLQTLAFGAALPENVAMILDPSLSADGKYSGIVETGTAGAALIFGDIIYQAVADDRWELAKADAASTSTTRLGICVQAAAGDGSATTILLIGKVRADTAFPTFTKYAPVYISSATAGDLSTTAPSKSTGHIVRCVGHAITADELWFQPDGTWLEYA